MTTVVGVWQSSSRPRVTYPACAPCAPLSAQLDVKQEMRGKQWRHGPCHLTTSHPWLQHPGYPSLARFTHVGIFCSPVVVAPRSNAGASISQQLTSVTVVMTTWLLRPLCYFWRSTTNAVASSNGGVSRKRTGLSRRFGSCPWRHCALNGFATHPSLGDVCYSMSSLPLVLMVLSGEEMLGRVS